LVDESVELCTIYLVDLVGSTALATSLGPARTDQLRDEYFGLLRHAIGATGGHEFQNTGDGLMVAFRSASSAIECAVLTQQLFEQRFRAASTPLRVRIGLATGEATVKQGEYFGLPAATAARLCDKAPADGILVSPVTKMVAERIDATCFESAGELALKGIPDPLEAFRVLWKPLDPERQVGSISRWRRKPPMSGASESAVRSTPRAARPAWAVAGSRCSRASLESARPDWPRTPRWQPAPTGSRSAGARARRTWQCPTNRGSASAASSSSTSTKRS
jgi:class 3 adenylate cyclase